MTEKLKLPPGFYANGTRYQGAGRWIDGNLMRWHNQVLRPINGWQRRADPVSGNPVDLHDATAAVRSGTLVTDEAHGANLFVGTNKAIYQVSPSNVVTNVTPVGFTDQPKDSLIGRGYGTFRYSYGKYGTPRPKFDPTIPGVFSWAFSEWGAWPIAVAREVGALNVFIKKDTDAKFIAISGSPTGAHDVLVTDERFVMTFGDETDFRIVRWSDRENYAVWAPLIENQAGSYRLAGTGKLLRGIKMANQILVLGENDAFAGRYVGPPYVYGFSRVGEHCGVVGPQAVAATEKFTMWLGDLSFWRFDGTVGEVPCEIMEYYQMDHERMQRGKTHAFTVSDYSEIWWLYQSTQSSTKEVDSYMIYNWELNSWYYGRLDRTWGIDSDPLIYPVMTGSTGWLYDHEITSASRDGAVPYITSGPLEMDNGQRLLGLAYVFPDDSIRGRMTMELSVRDNAQDRNPRFSRTFELADPTPTTGIMGRDIRMTLRATNTGPRWSVGDFRVEPLQGVTPKR